MSTLEAAVLAADEDAVAVALEAGATEAAMSSALLVLAAHAGRDTEVESRVARLLLQGVCCARTCFVCMYVWTRMFYYFCIS